MTKKNKLIKIITLIVFLFTIFPSLVNAFEVNLYSPNALIYDLEENKIVFTKGDIHKKIKIASLTKIMTSIVALENIEDLNEEVTISKEMLTGIPWDASIAGLKIGDAYTYEDLVYASLLPSGADATMCLAYKISGSTSNFVKLMNQKARDLGMLDTHFVNVTGYDEEDHYGSTRDVLTLLKYALLNEQFKGAYTTKEYTLKTGKKIETTINKYNKLYNYDISAIKGSKTGYTGEAGTCMTALVNILGRDFLIITLGAKVEEKQAYNLVDTMNIIKALNESYENRILYKKDEILFNIPVKQSNIKDYAIKVNKNITKFLEKSESLKLEYRYEGLKSLSFRNDINGFIGKINFYVDGKLFYQQNVYLKEKLKINYFKYFFPKVILIIIIVILSKSIYKNIIKYTNN